MNAILAIHYTNPGDGLKVLNLLRRQHRIGTLTLVDAAVVVKDAQGKVRRRDLRDQRNLLSIAAGLLAGALGYYFINLLVAIAVAFFVRVLLSPTTEEGFARNYVKEMAAQLPVASSVLFVLISKYSLEELTSGMRGTGGTIQSSTLPADQRASLQAALAKEHATTIFSQ